MVSVRSEALSERILTSDTEHVELHLGIFGPSYDFIARSTLEVRNITAKNDFVKYL